MDHIFSIGENVPESVTFDCDLDITGVGKNKAFQWYEASGRDSDGEPIEGETGWSLTIALDPETSFTKYYYCAYSYDVTNGRSVHARTNSARLTVSSAPTGSVFVGTGVAYYGPEEGESAFTPQYGSTGYGGGSLQTVGSDGTLSAVWSCVGRPFYMTWQWYVSDDADALGEPIGEPHTVWDPVEEDFVGCEANKKCDISLKCPSDEVGDRYYRVVCTNYAKNGDFFSCTSEAQKITTLPVERRDELFEVQEDGSLWGYRGFEDVIVVPAEVGGVAVTSIDRLCCAALRIELPEGVETIGESAFANTMGLREIVLPSTLRSIGRMAFRNCGLTHLEIPENEETIEFGAFWGAFTSRSTVTFRCGGCRIAKGAFYLAYLGRADFDVDACPAFNDGPLVSWLDKSHSHSFENCEYLYWITLPKGVTMDIPANTFLECPMVTWVENADSMPEGHLTRPFSVPCPFKSYAGRELFVVDNYLCAFDTVDEESYHRLFRRHEA